LPPPAVTELVMLPDGGCSPGFRYTVLQFLFESEEELFTPLEEAELDELLLSA
jgi:hypothetical protein